ncbi:MAG: sigma 54-interacting transcriptional regulator [Spirochaetes bacterium]|nr:sigma 54-interacting transcriptional regulator [Spirochaetota bacterium]
MAGLDSEILPFGVFTLDKKFRICEWNPALEAISGFSRSEMQGKSWQELVFHNPGEREKRLSLADCLQNLEGGLVQKNAELKTKEGAYRLVFLSVRLVEREDAWVIAALSDLSRTVSCDQLVASELEGKSAEGAWGLVGRSAPMRDLARLIELTAESDATALIQGETGTGKELVAAAIHHLSRRRGKPFLRVNCAALSETLLESELFGHAKGAFTGALRDKAGYFEAAEGGTLFLDEVGEISPLLQVRLLRVLQERTVTRVGEHRERKIDLRLLVATNRDLRSLVRQGTFREDLYYRLNVIPVPVPPLRERPGDVILLTEHFVRRLNGRTGKSIRGFTEAARRVLLSYCWPGNVREVENCLEHAFVVCDRDLIDLADFPHEIREAASREGLCDGLRLKISPLVGNGTPEAGGSWKKSTGRLAITAGELSALLSKNGGHRARTARELGISTVALWKKMKKFGIS